MIKEINLRKPPTECLADEWWTASVHDFFDVHGCEERGRMMRGMTYAENPTPSKR